MGMHWLASSASSSRPSATTSFAHRFREEQAVRMWKERSDQASWIDAGLKGPKGALEVLQSLTPNVSELVLSHNSLGDEGVRVLCEGLLDLRRRRNFPGIQEINLSTVIIIFKFVYPVWPWLIVGAAAASNGITDQGVLYLMKANTSTRILIHFFLFQSGLLYIVQYLLLSSGPPKSLPSTLKRLFLSNNNISLSPEGPLPSLLAAALSHPDSQLTFLSLISNEGIHLGFLKSCEPTSLRTLQIDTCALDDYRPLAAFIRQRNGGGRLEQLRANGNYFGTKGVRRLARLVAEGQNTSLTRFELAANSVANSRVQSDNEGGPGVNSARTREDSSGSSEGEGGENPLELDDGVDASSVFMIPGLTKALGRNAVLKEMTQRSGLSLLPYVRILMLAQQPPEQTEAQIMDAIAVSSRGDETARSTQDWQKPWTTSKPPDAFPWAKLPSEIRVVILRHLGQLIEEQHIVGMATIIQTRLPPKYKKNRVLTTKQFVKLLDFGADRRTLLLHFDELHTLRAVGCERWEPHDVQP